MSDRRIIVLALELGGVDGMSEAGRQVVGALAGTGLPVVVLSFVDAVRPEACGEVSRFVGAAGSRVRFAFSVLRQALSSLAGAQVFVVHPNLAGTTLPLLWRGAEVTVQLNGIDAWSGFTVLQSAALRRARRLLAISRHTAERFRARHPHLGARPVGVCHPACPEGTAAAAAGAIAPGFALLVGRMARVEGYKGHDVLLEAWPSVLAAVPGARLVFAGDGDDRERLSAKAVALGLGDAVTFTGRVSAGELAALYRDAAFLAMPSTGEGFGFVYLEAMRAGRACLASPGAAEEIVVDGVTGVIVPPERERIGEAIVRLFSEPATTAAMGRAGAERAAVEFGRESFARNLRRALELGPAVSC